MAIYDKERVHFFVVHLTYFVMVFFSDGLESQGEFASSRRGGVPISV